MALALRDGSVISEALKDARTKLKARLSDACHGYFDKLRNESLELLSGKGPDSDDLMVYRQFMLNRVERFDALNDRLRKALDDQLAAYDLGASELAAWLIAARASDKVRGG